MFAFMNVQQVESPKVLNENELNSNEQNVPFVAQDISNADLAAGGINMEAEDEKDESFEEILESREIIEGKIFRIKSKMIDYTVRQWDT